MRKQKSRGMQMIIMMLAALLIISIAYMSTANAKQPESPAPSDDVNIMGTHVVYFNTSGLPPLEKRQRIILQGKKKSTGCQYSIELKKTKDEGNITKVAREIAVNPDTCQQLVDLGTINKIQEYPGPIEKNFFQTSDNQSSRVPQSYQGEMQATMTTSWYDPIGIQVNYVLDQIDFWYDSNYVYLGWYGVGRDWYRPTHWYEVGPWTTDAHAEGSPATAYVVQSYDRMRNDWFLSTTTNVYYQPNTVKAFPGGIVAGYSNTWDDGIIAWMLHYEKRLS